MATSDPCKASVLVLTLGLCVLAQAQVPPAEAEAPLLGKGRPPAERQQTDPPWLPAEQRLPGELPPTFITKWGSIGAGIGEFSGPAGVAIDPSGNVYVADTQNDRIQKFDSSGAYVTGWGSSGTSESELNVPAFLAVDSSGNVYVADQDNHRIQKFTSGGAFVLMWGVGSR